MSFKLGDYVVVCADKSENAMEKNSFFSRYCLRVSDKGILIRKMEPESFDDNWWTLYVSEKRGTINYPETMLRNLKDYEKD